jgi:polyhydroxybutyrate depolymerase
VSRTFRLCATLAFVIACNTPAPTQTTDAGDAGPAVIGGPDRPVPLFMTPDAWDGTTPLPLLLVLHGYSVGGIAQTIFFNLEPLVNEKQIMLVAPDGLIDSQGERYWNAVDTCCDFDHRGEDDVAYLTGIVNQIAQEYPLDTKRVYVIGHSNGGAMALRLACDAPQMFAAILELAGPFWSNPPAQCHPSAPIPIRVLHGTADTEVPYDGGSIGDVDDLFSPGAVAVSSFWQNANGCSTQTDPNAPPLDLDESLTGPETIVTRFLACPNEGDVELWTIQGAGHIPDFQPTFHEMVWDYFQTHSR